MCLFKKKEKMKAKISGFKKSTIDGSERLFSVGVSSNELPKSYSYKNYLPDVLNQGENPICVPCSLSAFLNWRQNLKDGSKTDNKVNYFEIYKSKTSEGEGMTFKEAFSYLRHHGVSSKVGEMKIDSYGLIRNVFSLKAAIVMNGPCFGALPVFNYYDDFWNQREGDDFLGYHAISIVGYDEDGFIIRNSWGKSFGSKGYTKLKNEDVNKFIELWTVLG